MALHTRTYNIDIAQFVQPEIVRGCSCIHEVPVGELFVDLRSSNVEFVENPFLNKTF